MIDKIREAIRKIDELSGKREIKVVSHFDADGITSAAIFSKALSRWGKRFSLQIVKGVDESFFKSLDDKNLLIFLDLASGSLDYLRNKNTDIFIIDHHEILQEIPSNVLMINPVLEKSEPLSSAALCYLFAKELSSQNKDLANLAVIGMIGDLHDKHIGRMFGEILNDAEGVTRKGFLAYPGTRPLDRTLEYSFSPFIPGVSGSREGVVNLLRDAGIKNDNGRYKALYELSEEEMKGLVTAVSLRKGNSGEDSIVGNLFLIRFFNKLEDARELSALINSCSRMDSPDIALGFCLGNKKCKEEAEKTYINYKQSLSSALKHVSEIDKIQGKDYMIINARDKVKDTIIGTVASIISHSPAHSEGTVIIALAYNQDKIKVSARLAGRIGRNVRDVLHRAIVPLGGEVGGHPNAAGCLISKEREGEFIHELRRILDVEVVKV